MTQDDAPHIHEGGPGGAGDTSASEDDKGALRDIRPVLQGKAVDDAGQPHGGRGALGQGDGAR